MDVFQGKNAQVKIRVPEKIFISVDFLPSPMGGCSNWVGGGREDLGLRMKNRDGIDNVCVSSMLRQSLTR